MKKLPMNDEELFKQVFKDMETNEAVALSDVYTVDELLAMLDNGNWEWSTKNWIWSAIDYLEYFNK